jgi:GNAT superfamily N-acetyltransferase
MEIIRIDAIERPSWQLAGVFYVRTEGMVKGFSVPLNLEFADDGPDSTYLLALDEGLPIATCRLHVLDDVTAKIERVCVLEACRGKGTGQQLIRAAELWLKELGVRTVVITSRDAVVGFYEKLGYKADWNRVNNGFFKEIYMERTL